MLRRRSPRSILSGLALAAKPAGDGVTLIPVIEARCAVEVRPNHVAAVAGVVG